jgi:hypothetical protein
MRDGASASHAHASSTLAPCASCGRAHAISAWRRLELVDRIEQDRLAMVVTSWPLEVAIEVRRCTCGELMARTGM